MIQVKIGQHWRDKDNRVTTRSVFVTAVYDTAAGETRVRYTRCRAGHSASSRLDRFVKAFELAEGRQEAGE